jgi:plastocyanin
MRSRSLFAGLLAGTIALAAPSAAGALSKDVTMGVPNRAEGKTIRTEQGDVNDFFPHSVAINVGDSIRFRPLASSPHSVDIPGSGQGPRRWFEAAGGKVSGVNDASGNPFWFNGEKNVFFTAALQTRHFGNAQTYDGSKRVESGRSEGSNGQAMSVKFTKTGIYNYFCDLHPGMSGTVAVRATKRRVASKATDAKRVTAQMKAALRTLRRLERTPVPVDTVNVGAAGPNGVEYYGFLPAEPFVQTGHTVTFRISSASRDAHTATTGPADYVAPLAASFDGDSAPFDPRGFYPSERGRTVASFSPPTAPHGNAFWNSGLLDNAANTSRPPSSRLRFTTQGEYDFICLLHPNMTVAVKVVKAASRDPHTGGIKPEP